MSFHMRKWTPFFMIGILWYTFGCAFNKVEQKNMTIPTDQKWVQDPITSEIKFVVLLAHGLNLAPHKMDEWAKILAKNGGLVLRVKLPGHDAELANMKNIKISDWTGYFDDAARQAQNKAQEINLPCYFFGFSLGGLLGINWQEKQKRGGFQKMALLAPALASPWYSFLIKFFSFLNNGFIFPSRSPKEYRANKGTSLGAYKATFSMMDKIKSDGLKNSNIPTLVIIDKKDELIPLASLKKVIQKNKLSHWKLEVINNSFAKKHFGFRHLLVDENSMGKKLWQETVDKVLDHFLRE